MYILHKGSNSGRDFHKKLHPRRLDAPVSGQAKGERPMAARLLLARSPELLLHDQSVFLSALRLYTLTHTWVLSVVLRISS